MDNNSQVIFEKGQCMILALIIIKAVQYKSQNRDKNKQNQMESRSKLMLTQVLNM